METKLLASDPLEKCGVSWSYLEAGIEEFQMNIVSTTYRGGTVAAERE